MNADESRDLRLIDLVGLVLLGVLIACPVAGVFAVPAAIWSRKHEHEPRLMARVAFLGLAAAIVFAFLSRSVYVEAWHHGTTALVALRLDGSLWWSVLVTLPVAVPAGIFTGVAGSWAWREHREKHPLHGRERRARRQDRVRKLRALGATDPSAVPLVSSGAPVLGAWLEGDHPEGWIDGRWSVIPDDVAHIVALGATGSGKTQSVLRLAAAHLAMGWRVIVIDAKEEPETAARFASLARMAGVDRERCRIWPQSGPIDLCRGDAASQRDRWMACAAWTEPYYRAIASSVLTLVCDDPVGPPTSPREVVARMDHSALKTRWSGTDRVGVAAGIDQKLVQGVRYRYFSLISDLEAIGAVSTDGGGWSWEDIDAAWITLPTSTRLEVAGAFGRAAIVDLIGYLRDPDRRPDRRPVLLVIEEMGALVSSDPSTASLVIEAVERARSAGVRCILSAQTPEGLGEPDAQARLLQGGAAVLAHRMANPEPVVNLLGTQMGFEASLGVTSGGVLLDHGSLREQHQWQVQPDILRRLPVGHALFAHAGYWSLTAVALVPESPGEDPPDKSS
jgi:hypothetical protein